MVITEKQSRFSRFLNKYRPPLQNFFEGRLYPFLVSLLVLVGHISALEFYFAIVILLSASLAFLVCDTVKPFLPTVLTFVFLVNTAHAPGIPTWSDYYSQTYVVVTIVILFILLAASAAYFIARRVAPKIRPKSSPLFLPLAILSAAFLLNGAFSSGWSVSSLIFGVAEVAVFFALFYLFYYGLEGENTSELLDHICYIALLVDMVLIGEMAYLYISNENIIGPAGEIVEGEIMLGWGVGNPAGFCLIVLIPTLMRGAIKCRYKWVYLSAALLSMAAAFLTLSRNAMLFGALALAVTFIIAIIKDKRKWPYIAIIAVGAVAAIAVITVYRERIAALLASLINIGMADSGRFELWRQSVDNFLRAPIFGTGFFDWGEMDTFLTASFVPTMSHNTFFQLISSMGSFGLLAYGFYRVKTMLPFFKKPSFEKTMLLLPVLLTIGASLLDNFIFYFYTAFFYILTLAVAFRISDEENRDGGGICAAHEKKQESTKET